MSFLKIISDFTILSPVKYLNRIAVNKKTQSENNLVLFLPGVFIIWDPRGGRLSGFVTSWDRNMAPLTGQLWNWQNTSFSYENEPGLCHKVQVSVWHILILFHNIKSMKHWKIYSKKQSHHTYMYHKHRRSDRIYHHDYLLYKVNVPLIGFTWDLSSVLSIH